MATKKGKIIYSEPQSYFSKEDIKKLKEANKKKAGAKKSGTTKKKK